MIRVQTTAILYDTKAVRSNWGEQDLPAEEAISSVV